MLFRSVIKKFWENQVFGGDFKWITIIDFITDICAGDKRHVEIYKDAFSKMNDKQFKEYMQGIKDGTKKCIKMIQK